MKLTYLAITLALGICIGLFAAGFFSGDRQDPDDPEKTAGEPSPGAVGEAADPVRAGGDGAGGDERKRAGGSAGEGGLSALQKGAGAPDKAGGTSTADGFREMMEKQFRGELSQDEQLKFWEEARTSNHLAEVISGLEEVVAADDQEIAARMNLAQAYTVKLLGVPAGPEKGIYAAKAEKLWREVLEVEPDHYEAQYSIATSLSHYPPFLNKTGEAIAEFEKSIAIQEQPGSEITNPNAYLELSRLQLRDSDPASALQTLERAQQRHPEHAEIGAQLEKLKSTYVFEGDEGAGTTPEE